MSIRQLCLLAGLILSCLVASAADSPDARPPTAALIDRAGGAAAALVEARLLDDPRAEWVERNEIKRVLEERNLDAAFGAGGQKERLALGEQLKADLIVMLRRVDPPDGQGEPLLECMICETGRGLRLRMASARDVADESTVDTCVEAFGAAVRKQREAIREIVAVPPFMSDDLSVVKNHLQSAYARLVERALLDQPGIVVVEISEADAIAREETLAAKDGGVRRERLPMYLLGRYRHSGAGDAARVFVRLDLKRGADEIGHRDGKDLEAAQVAEWLTAAALALVGETGPVRAAPVDPRAEARQLAARGREFMRVGHCLEAIELFEASLLLDPQQEDVRHDVVVASGDASWSDNAVSAADIVRRVARYRRGLEHLETFLRTAGKLENYNLGEGNLATHLEHAMVYCKADCAPYNEEPLPTLIRELQSERRDTFLRIARFRSAAGFERIVWLRYAVAKLPADEQHALVARLLEDNADAPDFEALADCLVISCVDRQEPAFERFLVALSRSQSESVRQAVERARRTFAETQEIVKKMEPAEAPAVTAVAEEIVPTPIELTFVGPVPEKNPVCGCLPAGPGRDVFFGIRSLSVMKRRGELEMLWHTDDEHWDQRSIAFDGRYLWVCYSRIMKPPVLLVGDLDRKSMVDVTADDGLPIPTEQTENLFDVVRIAPLEPGRVCLAGSAGRRAWVGVATFDGVRKSVKTFYEARGADHELDEQQAEQAEVGFWPTMATTLTGRDEQGNRVQQVMVPRLSGNTAATKEPLLVDVARERVRPADFEFWAEGECGEGRSEAGTAVVDGRLLVAALDWDRQTTVLLGVAATDGAVSEVFAGQPEGRFAVEGKELHILGEQWSVLDTETWKLRLAASPVPWVFANKWGRKDQVSRPLKLRPTDLQLLSVHASNHYGVVATTINRDWDFQLWEAKRKR